MDRIKIKLLGRFEILVNDKRIDDQLSKSKKGCTLIQYLLINRQEAVPYTRLYEILWPNEESANPESALKTLVSRMRVILSNCCPGLGECIDTVRGAYRWVSVPGCEIDVFEFERISQELHDVRALTPSSRALFHQLMALYLGDLLPASSQENWVISRSVYLQNLYITAVYQFLDLFKAQEEYDEIICVCRLALEVNAFDERLHLMLMEALVKTNRNNEAFMQYKHATNLHFRYLGVKPPEGIQEFYKQIIQAGKVLDGDLDSIRNELIDGNVAKGAFVCEYAVFKEIYNLQVRSLERSNTTIFLGLVMVSSIDGQPIDPIKLDDVMTILQDVLRKGLRKGDTITHYTASQFALLLPVKSYDNGKMIIERIKRQFYKEYVNSSIVLNYRIGPITGEVLHPRANEADVSESSANHANA